MDWSSLFFCSAIGILFIRFTLWAADTIHAQSDNAQKALDKIQEDVEETQMEDARACNSPYEYRSQFVEALSRIPPIHHNVRGPDFREFSDSSLREYASQLGGITTRFTLEGINNSRINDLPIPLPYFKWVMTSSECSMYAKQAAIYIRQHPSSLNAENVSMHMVLDILGQVFEEKQRISDAHKRLQAETYKLSDVDEVNDL